jgi:oxygen-independent coproporphyrinogen-3 oxidase
MSAGRASLYVHVPFCAGACDYCDFYSIAVRPDDRRINLFIERLLADAEAVFARYAVRRVPTVYIGGGTPSLLGAAGIKDLLGALASLWKDFDETPAEITVEANPESADEAFLSACVDFGVTRVSLGVQSFNERSRRAEHRVGEGGAKSLRERLETAAREFPGAFSADIMTGLPYQSERVLLDDLETLVSCNPAHVSLYALTVEEGTPLSAGAVNEIPTGDEADRLWIRGRDFLAAAGFGQYEVSAFSRPGGESLHNLRYWRMESWLALGPAASATIIDDAAGTACRYTVQPDLALWLDRPRAAPPPVTEEYLDTLTLMKETFLMGFRTTDGPDAALFQRRFHCTIEQAAPATMAAWRERRLLRLDQAALAPGGLLFLNRFLRDCFEEIGLYI